MEQELLTPPSQGYFDLPQPRFRLISMLVIPEKNDPKKRSSVHDFYLLMSALPREIIWNHDLQSPPKYYIGHRTTDNFCRGFGRVNLRKCMLAFNHHIVNGYPHYEMHTSSLFKTLLKLYGIEQMRWKQ